MRRTRRRSPVRRGSELPRGRSRIFPPHGVGRAVRPDVAGLKRIRPSVPSTPYFGTGRSTSGVAPDPSRREIVASYKGNVDEYVAMDQLPCVDFMGHNPAAYPRRLGRAVTRTSTSAPPPTCFTDATGASSSATARSPRVYHVIDAATMAPVWKTPVGAPSARRGHRRFHGRRRQRHSTDRSPRAGICGRSTGPAPPRWVTPSATVVHWGNAVGGVGNGIVYTVDLKGFLDAYDGRLGTPLRARDPSRAAPVQEGSAGRQLGRP